MKKFLYRVSGWKAEGEVPQEDTDAFLAYQKYLEERRLLDFDDLLLETLKAIEEPQASAGVGEAFFLSSGGRVPGHQSLCSTACLRHGIKGPRVVRDRRPGSVHLWIPWSGCRLL